ncbi:hypothetical protein IJ596_00025 [bacterium]|nr:hypothetical protein [bacterium]
MDIKIGSRITTSYQQKHIPQRTTAKLSSTGIEPQKTNTLAGVGLLALGVIGGLLFSRGKTAQSAVQRAQKVFRNVFMRDNISLEETTQMIKRYKEIEQIPDKQEYIQALFNEAKKNYGFEKGSLHCKFINDSSKIGGKHYDSRDYIEINLAHSRDKMLEYIHHELKHAKQCYCAFNYDAEAAVKAVMEHDYNSVLNGTSELSDILKPMYGKYKNFEEFYSNMQPVKENILDVVRNKFGLKEFSKDLIPETQYEYAQKCIQAIKTTVDPEINYTQYYTNFLEGGDAYPAGRDISEALKNAFKEVE